jgi:hypothetical protein
LSAPTHLDLGADGLGMATVSLGRFGDRRLEKGGCFAPAIKAIGDA